MAENMKRSTGNNREHNQMISNQYLNYFWWLYSIRNLDFQIFKKSKIFRFRPRKHHATTRKPQKRLALGRRSRSHMNTIHMVRSTLLQLPPRGALRANFGGPLVRLFFRLQTQVLTIKKGSGNKSFFLPRVSNYEKSDGDHYFLPSAREISKHDQLWGHFWGHYDRKHEKKNLEPSGTQPNDF